MDHIPRNRDIDSAADTTLFQVSIFPSLHPNFLHFPPPCPIPFTSHNDLPGDVDKLLVMSAVACSASQAQKNVVLCFATAIKALILPEHEQGLVRIGTLACNARVWICDNLGIYYLCTGVPRYPLVFRSRTSCRLKKSMYNKVAPVYHTFLSTCISV